ncbi:amidohydrolase family protein [Streptomyces sp. NPDC015414]|uniref:amidohydrolase family protein n=1 Tax=Streptomyces sp. NPDC015414 TaxID=3364957 RepID=UPI0036F7BC98
MDTALVMPQPLDGAIAQAHEAVHGMAVRHPGRVLGIACIDPRLDDAAYQRLFELYVDDYGFVAVKLHTSGYGVAPDDSVCDKVFRLARRSGVPVIVHTGLGGPHTLPHRVEKPLARFDDVPVVLAHAGFAAFSAEATRTATTFPQAFLEPSWCPTFAVRRMLDEVGCDRVLFGSDHPENVSVEFTRFAALGLSGTEHAAVLGGTARTLFGLRPSPDPADTPFKELA